MKVNQILFEIIISTILIFIFYSLPSILYAGTQAPTESQVREAVTSYFGADKASKAAHHNLRTWGNQALPHLKKMASEKASKENSWKFVVSIQELKTKEAIDFLIEIADGKTNIDTEDAVSIFFTMVNNKNAKEYLENHPKFKEVIFSLASHENWYTRGNVAYIMGVMDWKDSLSIS